MILHSDREGNDCIRKLQCHCIQILHSDIYSVVHSVIIFLTKIIQDYAGVLVVKSKEGDFLRNLWPSQNILTLLQKFSVTAFKVRFGQ